MKDKKPTIGVIGLGIMGGPIAKNIKAGGYPVLVWNRSDKAAWAKGLGLEVMENPQKLGEKSDVIITMVSDEKAVREVTFGENGCLTGKANGKTWLQMSTVDIKSTLNFAAEAQTRGVEFIDCPVTGSKKQVEEKQLIILAAGQKKTIDQWRDLFMTTSKAIVEAGEIGKGTTLKLSMNMAVIQMTTAICEAVAFAKNQDLDPAKIFEVIGHSPALHCGYYDIKKKPLLEGDFSPAFSVANMLKDVRFMEEAAKTNRLPLPVTQAVRFVLEAAKSAGLADEDVTSIVKVLEPKSDARRKANA